jgi:hypothetical protein
MNDINVAAEETYHNIETGSIFSKNSIRTWKIFIWKILSR